METTQLSTNAVKLAVSPIKVKSIAESAVGLARKLWLASSVAL
jgi:hypothetical protein